MLRDPVQLALQVGLHPVLIYVCFVCSTWKAITVKERVMAGYRMPTPAAMPGPVAMLMKRCWDHGKCLVFQHTLVNTLIRT